MLNTGRSHHLAIQWINDNLRHESEPIDWSRAKWSNLNLNLGSTWLGYLAQLPLTADYYKNRMLDWVRSKCMDFGLMKRPLSVMMLPRGGGRTTFLYRLKLGEVVTTIPTIGMNVEEGRNPTSCFTQKIPIV